MESKARGHLYNWLDHHFNEFYSVWSDNDCKLHIIKHERFTLNEKFVDTLKKLYPDVDFTLTGFGYKTEAFTLFVRDFSVLIEPFDHKICHTDKED